MSDPFPTHRRITDDLEALLGVLPADLAQRLVEIDRQDELLEVILDLGRVPTARFIDREVVLADREVVRTTSTTS
jgi:stage III sporulation protein SpoIIIAA